MIEIIKRYLRQGWKVSVNRDNQLIFYDPDNDKFFTLGFATKKEREYIEYARTHNIRVRTRFIHRS